MVIFGSDEALWVDANAGVSPSKCSGDIAQARISA
jgi:hypothetical protein